MTEAAKKKILFLGLALGFALMLVDAFSLSIRVGSEPLAAKMVGGTVTQAQLNQAITQVGLSDQGEDRQRVLDFLIDEELLILRAQSVGLLESDRTIRKALSRAVIDEQVKEAIAQAPSDKQLRLFYQDHQAMFMSGEMIHLRQLFFKKSRVSAERVLNEPESQGDSLNAKERADATRRRLLVGGDEKPLNDPLPSALPDALIPVSILHRTLGPTMAAQVKTMRPGQISEVIESGGGYSLFICQNYIEAKLRPYEAIEGEVLSEYRRRARDTALENKLRALWARADIQISEKLNIDLSALTQ